MKIAPVINAEVQLLSIAKRAVFQSEVRLVGKYEWSGLPLGSYQASVRGWSFAIATRVITLRRVGSYTEDFVLVPGAIEKTITLTAARGNARVAAETPQIVTIFDSPRI
jgi:hypothetical protein